MAFRAQWLLTAFAVLASAATAGAQTLAFPFKAEDLDPGVRLSTGPHAPGIQEHGLDILARQLSGGRWRLVRPGGSADRNQDLVVYGLPFYAMAAGEVVGCWRNAPENPRPGEAHPERATRRIIGGGNHLWIRHADGTVALYAHAIPGSIPAALCPHAAALAPLPASPFAGHPDVDPRVFVPPGVAPTTPSGPNVVRPRVTAGQFLGLIGNSGSSSTPHGHFHLESGFGGASQALPMRFTRGLWTPRNNEIADINDWRSFSGQALPDRQVLVWPPLSLAAEHARHRIPASDLPRLFLHLQNSGFMPEVLNCYGVGGRLFFNMIWRPASGRWSAVAGVPSDRFQRAFDERGTLGPVYVDSCSAAGSARYSAIFRSQPGDFVARHDISTSDHQTLLDEMIDANLVPASVSVISGGSGRRYTVLYRQRNAGAWRLRSQLRQTGSGDQFQAFMDSVDADGLVAIFVDAYIHNGERNFVALASERPSDDWIARHGQTGSTYQANWQDFTGQGFLTRSVASFDGADSAHRFTAIWRRP